MGAGAAMLVYPRLGSLAGRSGGPRSRPPRGLSQISTNPRSCYIAPFFGRRSHGMMGMLAIVVSLLLLMYFAYRGVTVLLLAPLMAALAVLLSGELALLLPIYTNTFMPALAGYAANFLPIFLLGALFGQLIADSGAAHTLSAWIVR